MSAFNTSLAAGLVLASAGIPAAAQQAGRTGSCAWWCPPPPGGRPTPWRVRWPRRSPRAWGRRWSSRIGPASAATSAPTSSPRRPPTATRCCSTPPAPIAQALALYGKLPYDPQTDFVHIGDLAQPRVVCVVNASLPVKDFGELVAYAKANPGKLTVGSWGNGSQPHIVQSFMDLNFGTQTLHVPYKGEALLLTDLIGGQIATTCASVTALKPHLASGKLRALATIGPSRAAGLPDVPTFAESGYKQDVLRLTGPFSLLVPAKDTAGNRRTAGSRGGGDRQERRDDAADRKPRHGADRQYAGRGRGRLQGPAAGHREGDSRHWHDAGLKRRSRQPTGVNS